MPVNKVHCQARAGKGSFEVLELNDCLACAASGENPCQMTGPMVRFIHDTWKDSADRNPYSASKIGSCPRKTVLESKFAWGSDPMTAYAAMRGTLIHDSLHEKVDPEAGEITEVRVFKEFMGVEIGGQFDLLQAKSGILYDYKTVSKLPPFQWAYVSHRDQMNIYRWLLQDQELAGRKIDIKELRVQYMNMDGWKQCKAKLLDFIEVESMIARFINAVKPAMDAGDDWIELIPDVMPYDSWLCNYCDIKSMCYHLKDQQLMEQSMDEKDEADDVF